MFKYRLIGSDAVDKAIRIDTTAFPEMLPYIKEGERLFLVPKHELVSTLNALQRTGARVEVGVSDEGLTQLPPLAASDSPMRDNFSDAIYNTK